MNSDNIAVDSTLALYKAGLLGSTAATRFNLNTVVGLGDSRVAQIHADSTFQNKNAQNHFTIGNALAGNRAVLVKNLGVSGDRTDQILARLPAALATGAKWLYIHAGCNDIGQAYPSATTSGITAWTNIKTMIDAAVARGMHVIYTLEPGATNFTTAMIVQLAILNEKAREYAETCPGLVLFDLPAAIWDGTNASTTAITLVTSLDGTHENLASAYLAGKAFATLLTAIMPPRPHGFRSSVEVPDISVVNLLRNPMMANQAGGVVGAGASGTICGFWSSQRSGNATGVYSVGTASDGSGVKEQIIQCTFTAAGEEVRLIQDVVPANWSPGDILQASAEVVVDAGSSNLAGVTLYMQSNGSGAPDGRTAVTAMDGYCSGPGWGAATTEGYKVNLQTEKLPVPLYTTKSWVTCHLKAVGAGAGSATIRIRRFGCRKRYA
jgi:lysophospholipase L1-like esterase